MPGSPLRRGGAVLRPPWCGALAAALCAALTLEHGGPQPPFAAPRAARAGAVAGASRQPQAATRPSSPRAKRGLARVARRAGDPWSVLGIGRGSTVDEIKAAFRSKIRTVHPDRGGSPEQFQRVKQAYEDALDAAQTIGQGSSQSGLWPSGVSSTESRRGAWTMDDFFRFRREQLQREQEDWDFDASFGRQGSRPPERSEKQDGDWVSKRWSEFAKEEHEEYRDWRQRWRGSEQRMRAEAARKRAQEQARQREQEELQEALRHARARSSAAASRKGAGTGPDMWGSKWEDFDLAAGAAPRGASGRGPQAPREEAEAPAAAEFFTGGGAPPRRRSRRRAASAAPPGQEAAEDGGPRAGREQDGDPAVGYRTVSTTAGRVRVPVFQDASGSQYYTSPLTSKRVTLPR